MNFKNECFYLLTENECELFNYLSQIKLFPDDETMKEVQVFSEFIDFSMVSNRKINKILLSYVPELLNPIPITTTHLIGYHFSLNRKLIKNYLKVEDYIKNNKIDWFHLIKDLFYNFFN